MNTSWALTTELSYHYLLNFLHDKSSFLGMAIFLMLFLWVTANLPLPGLAISLGFGCRIEQIAEAFLLS